MAAEALKIGIDRGRTVSGLWLAPAKPRAVYVFAHGAGAGMTHAAMTQNAEGFAERGVATLRYQFPYMEAGARRVDPPALCHATVRAAAAEAKRRAPTLPRFAGGRSFGGRMTSQAQALDPLDGVRGLIFIGFPLHPAGKPAIERAAHLADVRIPMLFVQGARDELARLELLRPVVKQLGRLATLTLIEEADHSFRAPARVRKPAETHALLIDAAAAWIETKI